MSISLNPIVGSFNTVPLSPTIQQANPYKVLEEALEKNDVPTIEELVRTKQIDIHHRMGQGYQLIHFASTRGWCDLLTLLIAQGADVKSEASEPHETPLFGACHQNHPEAAKILIESGADLNQKLPAEFVKTFSNPFIDKIEDFYLLVWFPIDYVHRLKDERLLQVFLDGKVKITNTALLFALFLQDLPLLKKILAHYGDDINKPVTTDGVNIIQSAIILESQSFLEEAFKLLLPFNPKLKQVFGSGISLSTHLKMRRHHQVAQWLNHLTQGFCSVWELQTSLIVRFGLSIPFLINNKPQTIHTIKSEIAYPEIIQSFNEFYKGSNFPFLTPKVVERVIAALDSIQTVLEPKQYVESISRGEIVALDSGWHYQNPGHRVGIIFWKDLMFLCNRGSGSGKTGIAVYQIQNTDRLEELIKLLKAADKNTEHLFIRGISGNEWPELKLLETIPHKPQGQKKNCSWVSPKALLHALLNIALRLEGLPNDEAGLRAKTVYKAWTAFDRLYAFERYIADPYHQNPEEQNQSEGIDRNRMVQECLLHATPRARKKMIKKMNTHREVIDFTPLHWAILEGDFDKAIKMIEEDAELNPPCSHFTPLHVAASMGHESLCQKLIDKGAEIKQMPLPSPAQFAIKRGHVKTAKLIVTHMRDVNTPDSEKNTLLHHFCELGDSEAIEMLLKKGASVHARDENNALPLHRVANTVGLPTYKLLMDQKTDLNALDKDGVTLLMREILNENFDRALHLIRLGCDLSIKDKDGWAALNFAAFSGNLALCQALLTRKNSVKLSPLLHAISSEKDKDGAIALAFIEAGSNINAKNKFGNSALELAIHHKKEVVAMKLISAGCDITGKDARENSLLHDAANNGLSKVVQSLLEKGLDPNLKNKNGHTPSMLAIHGNHLEAAQLLLPKTACNLQDEAGWSELHHAVYFCPSIVPVILDKKPNVNILTPNKQAPLHFAMNVKPELDIPLIELLLSAGADLNLQDINGDTPLMFALNKENLHSARLLIERGCRLDLCSPEDRQTPLFVAASRGHQDLVELIVSKNPQHLDPQTSKGTTPLHIASYRGRRAIVSLLLEKGANPNLRDEDGDTPLHLAFYRGEIEIIFKLIESNADGTLKNNQNKSFNDLVAKKGSNI